MGIFLGHACCRNRHIIQHSGMGDLRVGPTPRGSKEATRGARQSSREGENSYGDRHPQSSLSKCNSERDFAITPTSSSQHPAQIHARHNTRRLRFPSQHSTIHQHLRHPEGPEMVGKTRGIRPRKVHKKPRD